MEDILTMKDEDYNAFIADLFPISKSKVSSYKFCPYQFFLKYLMKVKTEPSFKMITGIRFHNFAEKFFDHIETTEDWTTLIHDEYTPYEKDLLAWFISMEYARYSIYENNVNLYNPMLREVDIYNNALDIHGIIDRVDYIIPELIPYMEGEVSPREKNKMLKKLQDGKKVICVMEYKTGDSFYVDGLKEEISFYKQCLQGSPDYQDYEVGCGCVVNPKLKKIHYIGLERDETTQAKIKTVMEHIRNRKFPRTCSYGKYEACKLCEFDETGL